MDARQGCSSMTLALAAGQVQRVLVEAGSTLVVTRGAVTVHFPFAWLAESVVARDLQLPAEAAHCIEAGGWLDLVAAGCLEVVILPPGRAGFWVSAGQCVQRVLGAVRFDGKELSATGRSGDVVAGR